MYYSTRTILLVGFVNVVPHVQLWLKYNSYRNWQYGCTFNRRTSEHKDIGQDGLLSYQWVEGRGKVDSHGTVIYIKHSYRGSFKTAYTIIWIN